MMNKLNDEFIKELDNFTVETWNNIKTDLKKFYDQLIEIKLLIKVSDDFINKYNLNNDIIFICTINSSTEGIMDYYYKGLKMAPICHYTQLSNHRDVTTIEMLLECIKQNTHTPDIKHLEDLKIES
jgi:hypothetical protein